MPADRCTSKCRWPRVRLAASRQVGDAPTRMSSSEAPSATCFLKASRARPQRLVRQFFEAPFERVDLAHPRHVGLDPPLVRRAKQLADKRDGHCFAQGTFTSN